MKRSTHKKRNGIWKPVAAGFLALYLITMILSTWLVKGKYIDEYDQAFEDTATSLLNKVDDLAWTADEEGWDEQRQKETYQQAVNEYFWSTLDPSPRISVAVYDKDKKLLAHSGDAIGLGSNDTYNLYPLDDYLTSEEKETLAKYYWENRQSTADGTLPEKYRICGRPTSDGSGLQNIYVQQLTWEEQEEEDLEEYESAEDESSEMYYTDPLMGSVMIMDLAGKTDYATGTEEAGKTFLETDSKIVWEWTASDGGQDQENGEIDTIFPVVFPYMSTYESWRSWSSSEYLHGFPEQGDFSWEKGLEYPDIKVDSNQLYYQSRYQLKVGLIDDPLAYMEIRMEECPWTAALNYMKYVCFAGSVLTLACMFLVIYAFNKTYERQMALEQTRRDLTNAMAHELKTPLGIIRNFAENLIEHNMEEKHDYYLSQIVGQTEEMDHLVLEMIEISKLDSEDLVLKKEPVSMSALIHEQMERFNPLIQEKKLRIQYQQTADFQVDGDREYLAKAIWNLLSNAIDHNVPEGWIRVNIAENGCRIENPGEPLDEEQLRHAFDLFYTGDKSRAKKEKHMGLGLFLAEKIFRLHGISLALENTDDGIRVTVQLRTLH